MRKTTYLLAKDLEVGMIILYSGHEARVKEVPTEGKIGAAIAKTRSGNLNCMLEYWQKVPVIVSEEEGDNLEEKTKVEIPPVKNPPSETVNPGQQTSDAEDRKQNSEPEISDEQDKTGPANGEGAAPVTIGEPETQGTGNKPSPFAKKTSE